MDGLLRCSRYSFGPNRLHYCGPDANAELLAYIEHGSSDPGLEKIMATFATLFPYLKLIASANKIKDPFDDRVVKAYWIGNELLSRVERQALYRSLVEEHRLKKKIDPRSFATIEEKIKNFAVPHHSFHVFNVWRRTGNHDVAHTLESMDSCRISWGKVTALEGPFVTVETAPLIEQQGKLSLGSPVKKRLVRRLESTAEIEQLELGNIVSIHWGVPCEVIDEAAVQQLKKYTLQNINFANQSL